MNRISCRFYVQESCSRTRFEVSVSANVRTAFVERCPKTILGSVALLGWSRINESHVTEALAEEFCLSINGLVRAVRAGYCFVWDLGAAAKFKRPIPNADMCICFRGSVTWTRCREKPKKKMPPVGYLLARTQEILAASTQ